MAEANSSPNHAFRLFWRVDEIKWSPHKKKKDEFQLLGRRGWNAGTLQLVYFTDRAA